MPEIKIKLPEHVDDVLLENIQQAIFDCLNNETFEDEEGDQRLVEIAHDPDPKAIKLAIAEKEEEEDDE